MNLLKSNRNWLLLAVYFVLVGCAVNSSTDLPGTTNPILDEVIEPGFDEFLVGMVVQQRFSGVALVVRNGEIVHAKGYGVAAAGRPNNVDTSFHVASITKQFTAAAVLQLVESGSLILSNSINNYLPERYRTPIWSDVTVHHLLSHSSGITDYAGSVTI